jgi:hypothetical protein
MELELRRENKIARVRRKRKVILPQDYDNGKIFF